MKDVHESEEITKRFCDDYINGGKGIHICWSSEDFEKWLGFDMWDVRENFTANETLYTCLACNFKVLTRDFMKEHIKNEYDNQVGAKCVHCEYEGGKLEGNEETL